MHEVLLIDCLIRGMLGIWQALPPFMALPFVVLVMTRFLHIVF